MADGDQHDDLLPPGEAYGVPGRGRVHAPDDDRAEPEGDGLEQEVLASTLTVPSFLGVGSEMDGASPLVQVGPSSATTVSVGSGELMGGLRREPFFVVSGLEFLYRTDMRWPPTVPVPRTAGVVLQFGPFARAISILLVAAAVVALLVVSSRGRGTDASVLRIFMIFVVLALGAGAVETFGVAHRLVPGGIERVAPARKRVLVRWLDVESVEWSGRTGWYEVRARNGEVVRVYQQLTGMQSFARAALGGIPADVLDARPEVRQRLEQLASGVEPPDEPEREDWRAG